MFAPLFLQAQIEAEQAALAEPFATGLAGVPGYDDDGDDIDPDLRQRLSALVKSPAGGTINPRFAVGRRLRVAAPIPSLLKPRISLLTAPRTKAAAEADLLGNTRPLGMTQSFSSLEPITDEGEPDSTGDGRVTSQELRRAKLRIQAPSGAFDSSRVLAELDAASAQAAPAATEDETRISISSKISLEPPPSNDSPVPSFQRKIPDIEPKVNPHLVPAEDVGSSLVRANRLVPVVVHPAMAPRTPETPPYSTAHSRSDHDEDTGDAGSVDSFNGQSWSASKRSGPSGRHSDYQDEASEDSGPPRPHRTTTSPSLPPPPPPMSSTGGGGRPAPLSVFESPSPAQAMPTHNPHVARLLAGLREHGASPFKINAHLDASQLSRDLETHVYFTPECLPRVARYRPHEGDVVVCGVPRSGLTPIVRILDALKRRAVPAVPFSFEAREALATAVPWIEHDAMINLTSPISGPGILGGKGRLLRTHLPLTSALHGTPCPRGVQPMYKAVVVLRDPADVRVSWFRHLRRTFKAFHPDEAAHFDYGLKLDDFARLPVPRAASILENQFPEDVTCEALRYLSSPQVLVVMYEELLIDARKLVERLARFTAWGEGNDALIDDVAKAIEDDISAHPKWGVKRGSSGAGVIQFSSVSLRFLDQVWFSHVRIAHSHLSSYEEVYKSITGQPYPLPTRSQVTKSGRHRSKGKVNGGSHGSLLRNLSGMLAAAGTSSSSRKNSLDDTPRSSLSSMGSYQNLLMGVDPDDPNEEVLLGQTHFRRRSSLLSKLALNSASRKGSLATE